MGTFVINESTNYRGVPIFTVLYEWNEYSDDSGRTRSTWAVSGYEFASVFGIKRSYMTPIYNFYTNLKDAVAERRRLENNLLYSKGLL